MRYIHNYIYIILFTLIFPITNPPAINVDENSDNQIPRDNREQLIIHYDDGDDDDDDDDENDENENTRKNDIQMSHHLDVEFL